MQKPVVGIAAVALAFALTLDTADARRRHARHSYGYALRNMESFSPGPETGAPLVPGRRSDARRGDRHYKIADLVPKDWRLQPPDPDWKGSRYISPSGDAWLALYARASDDEPRDQHLKAVAFGEGEELTYLQRERDWIAVSGFKSDRLFYRKAVLACGERQWRHVAMEYPAESKRAFEPFIRALSRALDGAVDEGCEATVGRN